MIFLDSWLKTWSWPKGTPFVPALTPPAFPRACNVGNLPFNSIPEAALLLQRMLHHRPLQWDPGLKTWIIPMDPTQVVRRQMLLNLDIHQRSLPSLFHLDLHPTPKGKLTHYNRKSNNSIECFTLTSSRRSWHLPSRPNRLMVTEIDRWGEERNRQPEFFFPWNCWSCEIRQWWSHQ